MDSPFTESGLGAMHSLSVIIPSRAQAKQVQFLNRSIASVQAQSARSWVHVEVLVGIDPDTQPPILADFDVPVRFVNATQRSGGAAANAAAETSLSDYLAILEDDDVWDPAHLDVSLRALEHVGFTSGTQLEVDQEGTVVRVNDFATPDSWVMPRATWQQVGPFDTQFRCHADNEWLGRLSEEGIPRAHLVESTAPLSLSLARQVRPWLATLIDLSNGHVTLERHDSPLPLVRRLVHVDSLMHQISIDEGANAESDQEYDLLIRRYGHIPW